MERKGEITNVLVLVLALIPPNVPGIKGGVHLFSLTLTIALREAIEKQSWQILSGSVPEVPLYVTVRKKKHSYIAACFTISFILPSTLLLLSLLPFQHIYTVYQVHVYVSCIRCLSSYAFNCHIYREMYL